MSQVKVLINSVEKSRASYLNTVQILSKENIEFKKDEYSWNIIEITEHLYWAEFLGSAAFGSEFVGPEFFGSHVEQSIAYDHQVLHEEAIA